MLQVNDDMNDELFRRAAESYPLNTDNPGWDAVLNKMKADTSSAETEPIAKKRKNNYRFLLLLLLLIPFAIFENKRSFMSEGPGIKNNDTKEITGQTSTTGILNKEVTQQQTNSEAIKPGTINSTESVTVQGNVLKNNTAGPVTNITSDNNIVVASANKHAFSSKKRSRVNIKNAQPEEEDEITVRYPVSAGKHKDKKAVNPATDISANTKKETAVSITEPESKNEVIETAKKTEPSETPAGKEPAPVDSAKNITPDTKTKQAEKEIAKKVDEKNTTKDDKKTKKHTKHFYAGLVVAPDLSTIKLQSLKKVGLNYGFLIGYRFTKRLSIEAGLLQDRKYYSTDGKYFSTKNLTMSYNYTIEYVDGVCKMLELPVNVTYTFSKKPRSSWFGSVGVSSYFMQHESYIYDVSYNGYRYPKSYDYDNKSTSFLALVNISAGYTYKLGKIGDLRFEPYIKLPVNKIGTGELPIQSAGIFIGFTKFIF